jgi:hypothetical protein
MITSSLITSVLTYYAVATDFFEITKKQMFKTWNSFCASFESEKLLFLHGSKNLAVLSSGVLSHLSEANTCWQWSYEQGVFQQNGVINKKKKSLPWLSMSICHKDGQVIDITSWLEKIVYSGEEVPPFEVVVQAWSYDSSRLLDSLKNYSVKIMNELAEEEEHHLHKYA